ncbi:NAD(P)/FAD-dependent oxidoreductase [Kushneria phosphatilytica]|uniref:NAD(P)/FAD-dependent oxidoreductase n=1 Tax=Kushneria phosphatilytica TaxID=657387 RepID=A0A1S1NPT7_9GAMM|nr:NAD(P)/FAD-dependent oxidoreductase [Kushneria phosphatilytica]OHV10268.1 hypothetical protein BH688_09745 [Kushneria phosphatilytica]QEL11572.1 NAD(P)/FAD-dependent oxidoreductase [Kushneria phosphatilytica]
MKPWDVVIIGAGAAGMMCALTAGYRGRRVLLIEQARRVGRKILMSGGGRCNFTNLDTGPRHFFSANPHFCISALKRYTPQDFVELTERHGIEPVEKAPGQLFCADSSQPIVDMLLTECEWAGVTLATRTRVDRIEREGSAMRLDTSMGRLSAGHVVVATGGLSIPSMATDFGHQIARQFGLEVTPLRPALVPFTLGSPWKERMAELSGVSTPVEVRCRDGCYREPALMTHRGISGPAMLQASSHWQPGDALCINWLPEEDVEGALHQSRRQYPKRQLDAWLSERLPRRLARAMSQWLGYSGALANYSNTDLAGVAEALQQFQLTPTGTEGWRTAEVTMGGVDTEAISSKTFEVHDLPALCFIGEVLDVTGQLGGYNFQWAWASGVACGQAL